MPSKNFQILRILSYLLTFIALFSQKSSQYVAANELANVQGLCVYSVDSENIYSCELHNAVILNPTDVLKITGAHLPGYGDADVHLVDYQNTTTTYFNGEILQKFENLKYILLFNQGLREISPNAFDVCANLEELYIQECSLTFLNAQINAGKHWRMSVSIHENEVMNYQFLFHNENYVTQFL